MTNPPDRPGEKPNVTKSRRPGAFRLADETDGLQPAAASRQPRSFSEAVEIISDADDPFLAEIGAAESMAPPPQRSGFSYGRMAIAGLGALLSLAFGLWVDSLIRDLFARSDWLGYAGAIAALLALVSLLALLIREGFGLYRLAAVQGLKADAAAAALRRERKPAQAVVDRLVALLAARPETARGAADLQQLKDEVIDGPQLLELAERELLTPLDQKARALVLGSAKRVSVVTAVSPRAIVDLAYVAFEVTRMVRAMADLYGGRPGSLGMIRLLRDVVAHLAVTGSIAVGDSLAQQILGHGIAARLSTRLGEGVVNGLMTARIGIAAMDLCRPLPFHALKRPGIGEFIADLSPGITSAKAQRGD